VKRCAHKNAVIKTQRNDYIDVYCNDCQRGWCGAPYQRDAKYHHFTSKPPRIIKPPKWVLRTIEASEHDTD